MTQIFKPGQDIYLLYWRHPEDKKFYFVQYFTTKTRRDNANIDLLSYGMITLRCKTKIPEPSEKELKELNNITVNIPACRRCGSPMKHLYQGQGIGEWVCPNACGSTVTDVLREANDIAGQVLGDDEQCV